VVEIRNWADGKLKADPSGGARYRANGGWPIVRWRLYSGNIGNKQGLEMSSRWPVT
jgi:hypothetical protein